MGPMNRAKLVAVAAGSLFLLGACGGSDEPRDAGNATTSTEPGIASGEPTPTPPGDTPTSGDPAGRVVDFGEDGVTLTSAPDVTDLAGAPADFRAFIARELAKEQAQSDDVCTEKPQIKVSRIDPRGWAAGGTFIPQCGGNATLWAKPDGTWREVWAGQQLVDCATLKRYAFPADVAGGTCLDGNDEVPYAAAR
jgi:hypothetical protein